MPISTAADMEEDPSELKQFREQWKEEVRRRREEQQSQQQDTSTTQLYQRNLETHARSHFPPPPATEAKPFVTWPVAGTSSLTHTSHGQSTLSASVLRAVELYRRAVQHEQEGSLDEALMLYRQAFRVDPNVDRAYFKEEQRSQELHRSAIGTGHKKAASSVSTADTEGRDFHFARDAVEGRTSAHIHGILSKVLAHFPTMLTFEPEDDREGVPINVIPEEVLLCILRKLDAMTLERFAAVSRKARVLSLDPSIWRDFVYFVYKPPQIPETIAVQTIVDGYDSDYRQTYIQHPRLRLDGVYIAVCHYVRNGLGENAWVNVSHLVTYHRYLRFFPDGQVLSLLANEEYHPTVVIPMLKPSLRMKGFSIGEWRLEGTSVLITNLIEKYPHTLPSAHATHHSHVPPSVRYHFQMSLTLRSKPLGRWNKLDFASYSSVNVEDGEVVPLPLKHERPFWFSKVKSWQEF